jgi:hypothetical protein
VKLEEVTNGASLEGVEPSIVVTVVAAIAIPPDSLQLVYRLPDGALRERLVARADEASLVIATTSRPWSKVDTSHLMRRMVKEELFRFDGTPLFPERHAYTVNYTLSDLEATLYERVTTYVKDQMGRADALDGQRRGSVGFALTTLQRQLAGEESPDVGFSADPAARKRIELLAMAAVRRVEEERGCRVVDVSAQKCGWDLTSYPPVGADGKLPETRHIEVKGRVKGATTITVTRNEMLYALNQAEKFCLAIVFVGEDGSVEAPAYLRNPFDAEPGWGVSSINFEIKALLGRAERA